MARNASFEKIRSANNQEAKALDSQQILLPYMQEFAVGFTSSSPDPSHRRDDIAAEDSDHGDGSGVELLQDQTTPATSPIVPVRIYAESRQGVVEQHQPGRDLQPSAIQSIGVGTGAQLEALDRHGSPAVELSSDASSSTHHRNIPPSDTAIVPVPASANGPLLSQARSNHRLSCASQLKPHESAPARMVRGKMNTSQSSLTQENADRDYQHHYESAIEGNSAKSASQPIPTGKSQGTTQDERTLHEDDTGVVQFGPMDFAAGDAESPLTEGSSPIAEGPSLTITRAGWRGRNSSSQNQSSLQRQDGQTPFKQAAHFPETPAQPQNPFAGKPMLQGQALAASQLFGNTQQMSSAVKPAFSPTSSRPSPNMPIHNPISFNVMDTSPLKQQFEMTSPAVRPSTSDGQPTPAPVHDNMQTPAPHRWTKLTATVETPSEHPLNRARRRPEPMDTYEPMQKSQERRASAEASSARVDLDSEGFDDGMEDFARRRRVAQKKEAAFRMLTSVSSSRSKPNDIEVPSTTQKTNKTRADADVPLVIEEHQAISTPSQGVREEDISTVADSQDLAARQDEPGEAHSAAAGVIDQTPKAHAPEIKTHERVLLESLPENRDASEIANTTEESSRPVDMIPETSPLSRARAQRQTQSQENLGSSLPEPPRFATNHALPDPSSEASEPVLPQPFRRSGRRARPSAKVVASLSDDQQPQASRKHPRSDGSPDVSLPEPAHKSRKSWLRPGLRPETSKIPSDASVIPESSPRPPVQQDPYELPSSPPVPAAQVISTDTTNRNDDQNAAMHEPSTPRGPPATAPAQLLESTSSLSSLQATPELSPGTTPATHISADTAKSSPAKSISRRKAKPALHKSKTDPAAMKRNPLRQARQSRRSMRIDSDSTDELTRSPSAIGFENSIAEPRKAIGRASRPATLTDVQDPPRDDKLLRGMAFAVSFQSKRPGESNESYEKRMALSNDVERLIVTAGGRLLVGGFDELFDSTILKDVATDGNGRKSSLSLTPASKPLGFTALIADGHSRKVKYMQALALGLPCISDRWITTCLAKGMIVDWSSYLLCAGQSAFLRDAIRSRCLAPYSPSSAQLAEVINQRPQFLGGNNILLVMKRSRQEDKKMPYVFLAHVLGATLTRAYSITEARDMMKDREASGEPYGWVYVDEHTGTDEELFSDATAVKEQPAAKKRKRSSTDSVSRSAPKRVRTLNDELVIQSLILGRMIEDGELDA